MSSLTSQPHFRFVTGRHNPHAIRDRKFKCPMCVRTSKWQWDIKKHMRTVHKGRDGDVICLKENRATPFLHSTTLNSVIRSTSNSTGIISHSLFKNGIAKAKLTTTTDDDDDSSVVIGSDVTGNKKFKCYACPYRSNWKADLLRHIKKRHYVSLPSNSHVVVLGEEEAARTLADYESEHGVSVRKRMRSELDQETDEDIIEGKWSSCFLWICYFLWKRHFLFKVKFNWFYFWSQYQNNKIFQVQKYVQIEFFNVYWNNFPSKIEYSQWLKIWT